MYDIIICLRVLLYYIKMDVYLLSFIYSLENILNDIRASNYKWQSVL